MSTLPLPSPLSSFSPPCRIALVDSHVLARDAIRRVILSQPDMAVVGEAGDGAGACACHRIYEPDVVVIELMLPGVDGVEAAREIKQARPTTKVVGLSAAKSPRIIQEFLAAGGDGFVSKRGSAAGLIRTIREVQAGQVQSVTESPALGEPLSRRETALIRLVAKGYSNKEIAGLLEISTKTVETTKARAMQKAQLPSRVEIVRYGAERGWLLPE